MAQGVWFSRPTHNLGFGGSTTISQLWWVVFARSIIGRWAQWRQSAGAQAFTDWPDTYHLHVNRTRLSSRAAHGTGSILDALICTSTAGREVVEGVLNVREQQLIERLGVSRAAVCVPGLSCR